MARVEDGRAGSAPDRVEGPTEAQRADGPLRAIANLSLAAAFVRLLGGADRSSGRRLAAAGAVAAPRHRRLGAYTAALVAAFMLVPGVAASFSVGLYLAEPAGPEWLNGSGPRSYLVGTGAALLLWLLVSPWLRRYGMPDRANPATYARLLRERDRLRMWSAECEPPSAEAAYHLDQLDRILGVGSRPPYSLDWASANSYVSAWRRVHAAEEAVLAASKPSRVAVEGLNDQLRLTDSRIGNRATLVRKLALAIPMVDPAARELTLAEIESIASRPAAEQAAEGQAETNTSRIAVGTATIRSIRAAINEYRDDRREGLVRARNNLYATVIFTGATGHFLLGLALIEEARPTIIRAGAVFYLVGAMIGLFRQLRAASARDTVLEEDFGLSHVRLIHTPLFSGLAAIGGVVLVALLPGLTPEAAPGTEAAAGTAAAIPPFHEIFSLTENAVGLVWSALFGLAPALLITRLQREVEEYKSDLASSEASEQSAAPAR